MIKINLKSNQRKKDALPTGNKENGDNRSLFKNNARKKGVEQNHQRTCGRGAGGAGGAAVNLDSLPDENLSKTKNKDLSRHAKKERTRDLHTCITGNVKVSPSGRRKTIPAGNRNLYKRLRRTGNGISLV